MHAKIENDDVVEYPIINIRQRFPNASLPPDLTNDVGLPEGYVYVNLVSAPNYNPETHKIVTADFPEKSGDKWVLPYQVVPLTNQEIEARIDAQWEAVRSERNHKLAECDWTQLPDAPVDAVVWATYRQALRDVTTQANPFEITWPIAP